PVKFSSRRCNADCCRLPFPSNRSAARIGRHRRNVRPTVCSTRPPPLKRFPCRHGPGKACWVKCWIGVSPWPRPPPPTGQQNETPVRHYPLLVPHMKTLLITGGAGFIGANFFHLLHRERPELTLVVLDALTYAGNVHNLDSLRYSPRLHFVR